MMSSRSAGSAASARSPHSTSVTAPCDRLGEADLAQILRSGEAVEIGVDDAGSRGPS